MAATKINDMTVKQHKAFCKSVGFWSGLFVILLEVLYFACKRYTYAFEKRELHELRKLYNTPAPVKPKKKQRAFDFGELQPQMVMNKMQKPTQVKGFSVNKITPKDGRKAARISYKKEDGSEIEYTAGQLRNVIRSAKTEEHKNKLQDLLKQLEQHG